MCNRYTSPTEADIERAWRVGRQNPLRWWDQALFPRGRGPFIRRMRDDAGYSRELVAGHWGFIPWFAEEAKQKHPMNNARSEELADKRSFKDAWRRGQRCIIPALDFTEPNWESNVHVPWVFRRADGEPWGLAGIWNTWTDNSTGEVHESYSMLTMHANAHPLMSRMHRPEIDKVTKQPLPLELQDKRSVIPIELGDVDAWLAGTIEHAQALLRLPPVDVFDAGPDPGHVATQGSFAIDGF